jgi:chemotaxis protein CheC
MIELSDLEKDAFAEIFNIGVGHAAASLSQMIGQEVELAIPVVELLDREQAALILTGNTKGNITGVREKFEGSFKGETLLLFPEESSLELVRLLLSEDLPLEVLTEMEQEALTEVGNIILTGCLSSLADLLQEEITNDLPVFAQGDAETLLKCNESDMNETSVMFLKTMFSVQERNIEGYVTFLMELDAMDLFRKKVSELFGMEMES